MSTNQEEAKIGPVDAARIETWAMVNKKEAKALGMRLMTNQATPEKLVALESLGTFEDLATAWAVANPQDAKKLVLKLLPILMFA